MLSVATYNLNLSVILTERTSIENLIANGNYEAALRRYKNASLMKLVNKPVPYFPVAVIPYSTPNKEPLWILIRTALYQHANSYVIEGFPGIKTGGFRSGWSPGTPDKYTSINLANADLSGTKLRDCDFTLVDLYRANLCGADLRGSDFSLAFLRETDLRNCDLGTSSEKGHELAKLYKADSNQILFELAKSQLVERSTQDVERVQRFYVDDKTIKQWIEYLGDIDWTVRYIALSGLVGSLNYQEEVAVTSAIDDLFEQEVTDTVNGMEYTETSIDRLRITSDMTLLSELTYDAYFRLLLNAVAEIGDISVLPILVKFNTNDYEFLINAFVNIGEPIIDPLTHILNTGNSSLRISAAWVFGNMLGVDHSNHIRDKNLKVKIIQTLIDALPYCICPSDTGEEWQEICSEYSNYIPYDIPQKTGNWFEERIRDKYLLRRTIIRAFHMSGDRSIIPILEEISNNDLYEGKNVDGSIKEQVEWVINQLSRE
jgi:hypothetical protein